MCRARSAVAFSRRNDKIFGRPKEEQESLEKNGGRLYNQNRKTQKEDTERIVIILFI